ncbi:hypothetical protein Tco_1158141 [Tanacetum coccineum]
MSDSEHSTRVPYSSVSIQLRTIQNMGVNRISGVYPEYIPIEADDSFPAVEPAVSCRYLPHDDSPGYIQTCLSREGSIRRRGGSGGGGAPSSCRSIQLIPSPTITYTPHPPHKGPTYIDSSKSCLSLREEAAYEIGESLAVAATRPVRGRRVDYGFVGTMDTEIRRRRVEEVGYGIRNVWIDPREAVKEVAPMTLGGVNARVIELTAVQEQDTQDIYATARLLDQEALVSPEAQGRSIEVSYMTGSEILALRSVVIGQQAVISQLQATDRKSQVVTLEMLQANYQRQVQLAEALKLLKGLQTQMVEFQRQHGPVKGPAQLDAPGEAGSSS